MTDLNHEAGRIRQVYSERDRSGLGDRYAWHNRDVLLHRYWMQDAVTRLFVSAGYTGLGELDVLDVGCGAGAWLRTLREWGCSPARLHGVDLLDDRVAWARREDPRMDVRVGHGGDLDYPDGSFDVVFAITVLSSIPSPEIRLLLAKEMGRVVKPDGAILIYDFIISHSGETWTR